MPAWIRQPEESSSTPAALARTAWLAPFVNRVHEAIEAYFGTSPDGEDVTLAVLRAIGHEDLVRLAGARSLHRAKQDLGLFVAQTLVARFEAINVETWRRGRVAVTRRNQDSSVAWVGSYTPHRVSGLR